MSNTETFRALMTKFNVPVNNEIAVGSTGYLDTPVPDQLFTGVDSSGRVFINLPVCFECSDDIRASWHGERNPVVQPRQAFTVFQRFDNNQTVFVVGRAPLFINRDNLFSGGTGDFSKLETLLSGGELTFFETRFNEKLNDFAPVENRWIKIKLDRSNASEISTAA